RRRARRHPAPGRRDGRAPPGRRRRRVGERSPRRPGRGQRRGRRTAPRHPGRRPRRRRGGVAAVTGAAAPPPAAAAPPPTAGAALGAVVAGCGGPERARPSVGDVRDQAAVDAAVALAEETFGGLDAAVAVAGCIAGGRPAWETADEQWAAMVGVNLEGVWRLA